MSKNLSGLFFACLLFSGIIFVNPLYSDESADEPSPAANDDLRFSLVSVYETHVLFNLTGLDSAMESYGFQPIGAPVLIAWGIEGCFYERSGLTFGAKVTYGSQSSKSDDGQLSTYLATTKFGIFCGYRIRDNVTTAFETGFASFSQSVASATGGGAMVYLGPYIQPRITFYLHKFRWLGEVSVGYYMHFPLGPAHSNPLWEEPFTRNVIHGVCISIGCGFANQAGN